MALTSAYPEGMPKLLPLLLLSALSAALAAPMKLDLSKTGLKATITVPAGSALEKVTTDYWNITNPGDFTLVLMPGGDTALKGMASMKGEPGDVYSFKRIVTDKPDFYLIEGTLYGKPTFVTQLKVKVGAKTVICGNDLNMVYSRKMADEQIAACKSIKAK